VFPLDRRTNTPQTRLEALPAAVTTAALSTPGTTAAAAAGWAGKALLAIGNVLVPSSASVATKTLRVTALFVTGLLVVSTKARRRLFWPGLTAPENTDQELLPGGLGCPFMGSPWVYTSSHESYGAGNYYRKAAHALAKTVGYFPKIWKYYVFGQPFAVLSGGKTFQKILNREFDGTLSSAGVDLMEGGLLPTESLLFEKSKKRHQYLRKLVGSALTPTAVAKTAPLLQKAADEQIVKMEAAHNEGDTIRFHKICNDYTLDVAWRQILGLELAEEEIPIFEDNVEQWISGIMSLQVVLKWKVEKHPGYAAREYVISKIEERIDYLLENGPDNLSTLSGMVFATDEDDPTKKLSRKEIIDNALILIFAGSETSANTLTNAMLFLGLHPTTWNQMAEEQASIRAKFGETITPSTVDPKNAPYLDAVLKETMRMRVVVGGIPRMAFEDIDVDGDGKTIIPKGYLIDPSMLLTHEEDPNVKLPDGMHLDAIRGFRPERWLDATEEAPEPDKDWYVPYGFGPRYCLGKNLAQLEMKIFLATLARKIEFPKLTMLPENYDYSRDKKDPSSADYFSVEWSTKGAVIPTAGDGVTASVATKRISSTTTNDNAVIVVDNDDDYSFPVLEVTPRGISNSTETATAERLP